MDRGQIEEQYKWDLRQVFDGVDEFNRMYDEVKEKIKDFSKYETTMDNDATSFYNSIKDYYEVSRMLDKLYVYTSMNFDTDTSNNQSQALKLRASNLYDEWSKAAFFVTPTILKKDYQEILEKKLELMISFILMVKKQEIIFHYIKEIY